MTLEIFDANEMVMLLDKQKARCHREVQHMYHSSTYGLRMKRDDGEQ